MRGWCPNLIENSFNVDPTYEYLIFGIFLIIKLEQISIPKNDELELRNNGKNLKNIKKSIFIVWVYREFKNDVLLDFITIMR